MYVPSAADEVAELLRTCRTVYLPSALISWLRLSASLQLAHCLPSRLMGRLKPFMSGRVVVRIKHIKYENLTIVIVNKNHSLTHVIQCTFWPSTAPVQCDLEQGFCVTSSAALASFPPGFLLLYFHSQTLVISRMYSREEYIFLGRKIGKERSCDLVYVTAQLFTFFQHSHVTAFTHQSRRGEVRKWL